ncbi:hypothetical protein K501DRAFT_273433 [Backusella circina FSU 941]|nr:hypothetical protein K501DRAFT_273433 [Backusella circina FSU 941]
MCFPNSSFFYIDSYHYRQARSEDPEDSDETIKVIRTPFRRMRELRNSIRHITDYTSAILTPKLLESGPCPNLTTHELTFDYALVAQDGFKPLLKDVGPHLVSLAFDICKRDETMDRYLSRRLPKLKSLTLNNRKRFEVNLVFKNLTLDYLEITASDQFSKDSDMKPQIHFQCVQSYFGPSKLSDTNDIHMITRPQDEEAYITVVIGSVKTLVLNDYVVYNLPRIEYPDQDSDRECSDRDADMDYDGEWTCDQDRMMRALLSSLRNILHSNGDMNELLSSLRI